MTPRAWMVAGIAGLALLLRLGFVFHEPVTAAVRPDTASFTMIAHHLVSRGEFSTREGEPSAYRPPVYPFFLAIIEEFAGPSIRAILVVQAFCGMAVVLGVMAMAHRLSSDFRTAVLAGIFAAVYPFFIYYDASVLAESLLTFLTTAALVAYLWWSLQPKSWVRGLSCTLAWATLVLIKTVLSPVFWLTWIYEWYRGRVGRAWLVAALALFELPTLFWGLRNEHALGRRLIDSHGGQTCYECVVRYDLNKQGIFSDVFEGSPVQQQASRLKEADRDRFYFGLVKQFVRDHPGIYLKQCLANFKDFWRFYPRQDLKFAEGSRKITLISLLTEPFLILAGLWGAWKARHQWTSWFPAILTVLVLTAIHSATCSQMRYRLPLMPLFIALAAYAVVPRRS